MVSRTHMQRIVGCITFFLFLFVPSFVLAQPAQTDFVNTFAPYLVGGYGFGVGLLDYLYVLVPFALSLSVLFFLWGLAKFVYRAGDPKSHEDGRRVMIWGVIAIFVFVSIYGIMEMIANLFGIDAIPGQGIVGFSPVPIPGPATAPPNSFLAIIRNDISPFLQLIADTLIFLTWLVFFFGIARFMWALSSGEKEGIAAGKFLLFWGVVVLTVSLAFWSIMAVFAALVGATPGSGFMILLPQFRTN